MRTTAHELSERIKVLEAAIVGLLDHERGLGGTTICDRLRDRCPHWTQARAALGRNLVVVKK